jgi:quinol monooxygenase YgiN
MIIVAGTARVSPGALERAQGAMQRVIAATRRESGCLFYSYGVDVTAPDTILILEYWKDTAALKSHFAEPHIAEWMKTIGEIGVLSQDIKVFEVAGERPLAV